MFLKMLKSCSSAVASTALPTKARKTIAFDCTTVPTVEARVVFDDRTGALIGLAVGVLVEPLEAVCVAINAVDQALGTEVCLFASLLTSTAR